MCYSEGGNKRNYFHNKKILFGRIVKCNCLTGLLRKTVI